MDSVVAEIEQRLEAYEDPIEVSVLGCAVNGIGEARHADFGITGAKDAGMIFSKGEPLKKVPTDRLVDELFAEIDRYYAAGKKVVRDEHAAAEAAQWLSENEDDSQMTPGAPGRDGGSRPTSRPAAATSCSRRPASTPRSSTRASRRSRAAASRAHSGGHGLASRIRLNGVSVARRTSREAALPDHLGEPRLAGLGAEREPDLLSTGRRACRSSSRRRRRPGRPG